MMAYYYPALWRRVPSKLLLVFALSVTCSLQAQKNIPNSNPTLDTISDYTTSFSDAVRYIELSGITAGEEIDQQVFIEVSTENRDLIESIGADLVDNGKAFINYHLKPGAVGTAVVKVILTDDGPSPSRTARTFRIIVEGTNREPEPTPVVEKETVHQLKAVPNPASVSSRIFFSTPIDEDRVSLDLYSLSGAKIKQLFTGNTVANQPYSVDFNSRNFAAGVYIVRLTGNVHSSNLKLVVAK